MIGYIPRLCELFRNAVSSYGVELLATRPINTMEGIPSGISATIYSVYLKLSSISVRLLIHRILTLGHKVLSRKHLISAGDTLVLLLLLLM